ncbi:unnamed protein product [Periconia digitata]|uniref:Uncharacterized protein n=1 Tax=Periconia digitata TaxID=1303443 RepID=A0A9W4UI42_9PLEO|nr:unnamed protein product [Periconia digitata]
MLAASWAARWSETGRSSRSPSEFMGKIWGNNQWCICGTGMDCGCYDLPEKVTENKKKQGVIMSFCNAIGRHGHVFFSCSCVFWSLDIGCFQKVDIHRAPIFNSVVSIVCLHERASNIPDSVLVR